MNKSPIADKLHAWEVMVSNMAPLLEAHSFLTPIHGELGTLLTRVRAQSDEIERMRGAKLKLTRERAEAIEAAEEIYSRASNLVRGIHGNDSEDNIQLGVPARGRRRKSRESGSPTPPPAPAGSDTPSPK